MFNTFIIPTDDLTETEVLFPVWTIAEARQNGIDQVARTGRPILYEIVVVNHKTKEAVLHELHPGGEAI